LIERSIAARISSVVSFLVSAYSSIPNAESICGR
jgi:hypothetical protein